jgi:hypothetical protein
MGYAGMGMAIAVQGVRGVVACRLRPTDAPWQINVSRSTTRSIGSPSNLATWAAPGGLLKATLVAAAVAAAVLAATPAAHAQDAPAAGQSPSAPAASTASSAPSSPPPASTTTGASSSAPPAAGEAPAGQSTGSKTDPVCFKLTGHCVDSSKAAGTAGSTKAGSTTGKKPLNLTAPDVRTVVPESELKEPLPNTDQITETQEADTVSVQGDQGVPPDVPGGFGAIWWAVNHPSQAWRILTPAE